MLHFGNAHSRLDLDAVGKRAGHLCVTHSDDALAFSTILSPLAVIRGAADGPTVLLCAGNHGDEYEGQLLLRRLFERVQAQDIRGRIILAPALNMPAVLAQSRVSPLDGGNLNRSFPGDAFGGPTQDIAGFVATQLLPLADLAIDIHSGGTQTNYVDTAYFCLTSDKAYDAQTRELCEVMGLPFTMVVPASDTSGDFDAAAYAAGCAMISCELGGEGKVNLPALEAGWQGILRLLAHQGVLTAASRQKLAIADAPPTRFLTHGPGAHVVTAHSHGIIEPLLSIGNTVTPDQAVMRLRDLHDLEVPAQDFISPIAGVAAILRRGAVVAPGDHLAVICPELTAASLDALMS